MTQKMTAAELIRQLENDPEYQEMIKKDDAKLEKIWKEREAAEAPIVQELNCR